MNDMEVAASMMNTVEFKGESNCLANDGANTWTNSSFCAPKEPLQLLLLTVIQMLLHLVMLVMR